MIKKLALSAFVCITVFKGQSQFTKILDFNNTGNGLIPKGDLISDGTFLYGMTYAGGPLGNGLIFKIKPIS